MFGIYIIKYWTCLPVKDPLTMGSWIPFENKPIETFSTLNEAINALKSNYSDKVYTAKQNNGTECSLCYVLDSSGNVIASINFDRTLQISLKGCENCDKT